jgi:methanogenic corrinoid protein MtbC1
LEWLAEHFADHLPETDGRVVWAAVAEITAGVEAADPATQTPRASPVAWPPSVELEAALLAGDHRRAQAIVDDALDDYPDLVAIELHVVQPALYAIGWGWEENRVSVAQEHLATAIAQAVMTRAMLRCDLPGSVGRKVLLACVEGNHHELGLRMVADAFELAGWEVHHLGADVPTSALIGYVGTWQPDLLALSISFPHQLGEVITITTRLRTALGDLRPPVIVGGLAINQFGRLAALVGADAWSADAAEAVATGARLVEHRGDRVGA